MFDVGLAYSRVDKGRIVQILCRRRYFTSIDVKFQVESDGFTIFDVKLLELRLEIDHTRLKVFYIDF